MSQRGRPADFSEEERILHDERADQGLRTRRHWAKIILCNRIIMVFPAAYLPGGQKRRIP